MCFKTSYKVQEKLGNAFKKLRILRKISIMVKNELRIRVKLIKNQL